MSVPDVIRLNSVTVWLMAGLLLALAGCQSRVDLQSASSGSALMPQTLATAPWPVQALLPAAGHYPDLRVYIEGDGHAWATRSQPSTDPTPMHSLMIDLAVKDRHPAAYLARPCQFVMAANCEAGLWTARRFSPQVLAAMNMALDQLKRRLGVERFELVGHSGGGAIALVLAATRHDVVQVQTLAGNLDPDFWSRVQGLDPLQDAQLPLAWRTSLRIIAQRHFVGLEDPVVPPSVARSYVTALGGQCVEVLAIHADHARGYENSWAQNADRPVRCNVGADFSARASAQE
jgi:pimeloyl-ACP methyl ester carboxylesterase